MTKINVYFYSKGMDGSKISETINQNDCELVYLYETSNIPNRTDPPKDFKLAVVHHSDWNSGSNKLDRADLIIFLNAGEQLRKYDGNKTENRDCIWWDNSAHFIETFKLLKEFMDRCKNNKIPTIQEYQAFIAPVLPALQILCQGYLVVYHRDENEFIQQALNTMGWANLKLTEEQSFNLSQKVDVVNRAEWWSHVLLQNIEKSLLMARIDVEWSALGKTQGEEYQLLNELINKIINPSDQLIEPKRVAETYLSIIS